MQPARISLSQTVRPFAFGKGIVLWEARSGGLFVCNRTLLLLWPSLAEGTTLGELAALLADAYDVERHRALADCAALLDRLQSVGLLAGERAESPPAGAAEAEECLDSGRAAGGFAARIHGLTIRIVANAALAKFLQPLFPDGPPSGSAADVEIECLPDGKESLVAVDGIVRARIVDPAEIAGAIFEQVIRALHPRLDWLAFLHAGSVRRNGAAIVLPAASGSGKSTLIGFLASNGFDYLSDDLVPLAAPRGEVAAFPLSINLKAGSRGLYPAPAGFEAVALRGRFRTDQLLVPPRCSWETPPTALRAVVFPRYEADRATSFAPIEPLDGLARLFGDRIFLGYPLEEARIANFLRWAEGTPFYALEYSELTEATRCLADLTD